jgi:DNA repair protein RecO (recombination protein O)
MPARLSEAFVLQTYPFQESDLVVSFLTRDQGKLRGIAKRARRPKSSFGAGLERLSQVKMSYFQRETRELVNLDSCDLVRSQFDLLSDYGKAVALDWRAVTYFSLWATRLAGILPELDVCMDCGNWLDNPESREPAFFSRSRTGLYCGHCRKNANLGKTWELSLLSRDIAKDMLHKPIGQLAHADWQRETGADLRHFLVRQIEHHIERTLVTAPALEAA